MLAHQRIHAQGASARSSRAAAALHASHLAPARWSAALRQRQCATHGACISVAEEQLPPMEQCSTSGRPACSALPERPQHAMARTLAALMAARLTSVKRACLRCMRALERQRQHMQTALGNESGLGMVCSSMGALAPLGLSASAAAAAGTPWWVEATSNKVLMSAFWAWFLAQFGKIFTKRYKKGVWDLGAVVEPGGMPSSHSSLCSGVTTAIAMHEGLGSPLFAMALSFSVIVMYDAMGVRRHAGRTAEVLNQVIFELMEGHPISSTKLKEVLGHTPRQVICGAVVGVLVALAYPSLAAALLRA